MNGSPPRVLLVCTANRARSPMAEVIARDLFERSGLATEVGSAGFLEPGWPAEPEARRVAAKRGLDLSSHMSRQLDDELVASSDLILTMTGDHVLRLTAAWPKALTRTFALGEVAEWGVADAAAEPTTARSPLPAWEASALRTWLRPLAEASRPDILGGTVDVADPMGQGVRAFRRTAALIESHVRSLIVAVTGAVRP